MSSSFKKLLLCGAFLCAACGADAPVSSTSAALEESPVDDARADGLLRTATVGASGGEVRSSDGRLSVEAPASRSRRPRTVTVQRHERGVERSTEYDVLGPVYEVAVPAGAAEMPTLDLSMSLAPIGDIEPPSGLMLVVNDGRGWRELPMTEEAEPRRCQATLPVEGEDQWLVAMARPRPTSQRCERFAARVLRRLDVGGLEADDASGLEATLVLSCEDAERPSAAAVADCLKDNGLNRDGLFACKAVLR